MIKFKIVFGLCKPFFALNNKISPQASQSSIDNFFKNGSSLKLEVFNQYVSSKEFKKLQKANDNDAPVIAESPSNNEIQVISYIKSDDKKLIKKGKILINGN